MMRHTKLEAKQMDGLPKLLPQRHGKPKNESQFITKIPGDAN